MWDLLLEFTGFSLARCVCASLLTKLRFIVLSLNLLHNLISDVYFFSSPGFVSLYVDCDASCIFSQEMSIVCRFRTMILSVTCSCCLFSNSSSVRSDSVRVFVLSALVPSWRSLTVCNCMYVCPVRVCMSARVCVCYCVYWAFRVSPNSCLWSPASNCG